MAFRLFDRLRLGILNPRFITGGMLAIFFLLALVLAARWLALLMAPRPLAVLQATVDSSPRADFKPQAAKIFGLQPAGGTGLAGYSLAGVYASSGGEGMAVFVNAQKQLGAKVGEEFAPGVRLTAVERGQVRVSVNGREQILVMAGGEPPRAKPGPARMPAPEDD